MGSKEDYWKVKYWIIGKILYDLVISVLELLKLVIITLRRVIWLFFIFVLYYGNVFD